MTKATYGYQWLSDDVEIGGATGWTYTLVADDEGSTIKVRVIVTDDAGNETTLTSAATEAVGFAVQQQGASNTPATGQPTIRGTAQVGEVLTADTTGIADADGLTKATYSYQWVANDGTTDTDISGATDASYTLVADDEGSTIKVRVIVTDDAGNETTLTSAATEAVAARPEQSRPLTGLPTHRRDGRGGRGDADGGHHKVQASPTTRGRTTLTTAAVAARPNTSATGLPTYGQVG